MKIKPALPCALAAALLGSGCMSFKVGSPEIRTAEYKADTAFGRTLSREAVDVEPAIAQDGAALRIGLKGSIETTDEMADFYRKVSITRQKRLSFGFFPATAEAWFVPKNGLSPLLGMRLETDPETIKRMRREKALDPYKRMGMVLYEAPTGDCYAPAPDLIPSLAGVLWTPWALLVTPFSGEWECSSHHWTDRSGRNSLRILSKLAPEDRAKLGVNTCDSFRMGGVMAHSAWFGFHRYLDLSVSVPVFSRKETWTRTKRKEIPAVAGPYEIEVEIPSIGYRRRQGVLEGQTEETFFLPSADRSASADATIRFFPSDAGAVPDGDQRAVLNAAQGLEFRRTVRLPRP